MKVVSEVVETRDQDSIVSRQPRSACFMELPEAPIISDESFV